jgi:membrane dipeptidase
VDLTGAIEARIDGLFLAVFVEPPGLDSGPSSIGPRMAGLRWGLEQATILEEILQRGAGRVAGARSAQGLLENRAAGKLSLVLSLENAGDVCEGSLRVLSVYRRLGVRCAGLVWFARNPFGSGVGQASDPGGLSPRGIEAVRALGAMGMAVDVSHLNPAGVRDVLEAATGPVVATHSNARAVCDHPRNLDNDSIREIAARGGVVGLCLFPKFLRDPAQGPATIEDAVRHLEHIASVGGPGCIASGSDFDGISSTPEGLRGIRDLPRISEALRRRGWSDDEISRFEGGNAFRVLEMLGE